MDPGRRALLATALGACALPWLPRPAAAQSTSKTRLILLGTGGGPRPRKAFAATSQVIIANGTAYLVDCGDGVARQLAAAGVPPVPLRHVFITHQHSDHNADYGNLFLLLWAFLPPRVDAWGPPPLAQMTKLFFEMNAFDINTRIEDEGRLPLVPIVHPHEVSQGGVVMKDENVTVTAALVDHPPIENAFAYRFAGPVDRYFGRHGAVEEPRGARQRRRRSGPRSTVGPRGGSDRQIRSELEQAEAAHHRQPHVGGRLREDGGGGRGEDAGAVAPGAAG
jgi:hypothetical protein